MKTSYLISILLIASCGSKSPKPAEPPPEPPAAPAPDPGAGSATAEAPPAPAPEPPVAPAPPPTPAEDTFLKLTKEEKTKIMKEKVTPMMAKAFKAQDPKKFKNFNCKTCHGKSAGKDFKMPNPDLPKLDFAALQSGKLEPKVAAMAEFMAKTVTPEMAKTLELTHFDPQHPELGGFGCLACHEMKK